MKDSLFPDQGNGFGGEPITFPKGEIHGVTVYVQLNDNNKLYKILRRAQQKLNNKRDKNGNSDNPHNLGELNATWTNGEEQIGFFSSKSEYGIMTDEGFNPYRSQFINLYSDISNGEIASNPAKRCVRVHKRSDDLVYKDGNEYTWPPGWMTGKTYEGSVIEIEGSYIDNPGNAIADAFELIEATGLLSTAEMKDINSVIPETVRFGQLECYHRIDSRHEYDAVEVLRDSARLAGNEGDGWIKGEFEKGHHRIYGLSTDSIYILGHKSDITWTYRGKEYSETIDTHYLKLYQHITAETCPDTDPLAHPKFEVKANDTFPGPAWNAVENHLNAILNAHIADYAAIPIKDLVADNYHDGPNQDTVTTQSPKNYRINLKDYFKSTGLKKEVISLITNNRSESAKDILYTVIRLDRPVPYDELKSETGLTKGTIQKWVRKLEEIKIVKRKQSGQMFVHMSDFARKHLRGFIEEAIVTGDIKRAIRRRKYEREADRKSKSDEVSDAFALVMTDNEQDVEPAGLQPQSMNDTNSNCKLPQPTHLDSPPD